MDFLRLLEGLRTPWMDEIMYWITQMGDEIFFLVFSVLMFWCIDKKKGYYLLSVGFIGTEINQLLKLVFRIPRPWVLDPDFTIVEKARAGASGYSFPSGHTQNIVGTMGGTARSTKKGWVRIICIAVMVLVGFSRMYLGVHTPKDVLTSAAVALLLVFGLYPVFQRIEKEPKRMWRLFGGMAVLGVLVLLYVTRIDGEQLDAHNLESGIKNANTLLGAMLGMMFACYMDSRRPFGTEAPLLGQTGKLVIGLILVLAVKGGLKAPLNALFNGSHFADLIRYFLVVAFAGGVWPLTFAGWSRLGRKKEKEEGQSKR